MRTIRILTVFFVLLAGCSAEGLRLGDDGDAPGAAPSDEGVDLEQNDDLPPTSDVADVVADVLPSVVNVRTTTFSSDLFGNTTEGRGQGSGVIIDSDGIIVTNNHVVADALEVEVVFNDDKHEPVEGRVVGTAPEKDLAVIKVDVDDLDPVELGTSGNLRLGDDVIAVGFPLGLGGATVTKGIISGRERSIEPGGAGNIRLEGLLQTDAAINPGNSGGALVDGSGRLVGINTAAAQASAAENIGFAIAIDSAVPVIEEILNEPQEERAWMGVIMSPLDAATAGRLDLDPSLRGVLIEQVVPGDPADEGGIEPGDVIVAMNGTAVETPEDVSEVMSGLAPGDEVELSVVNTDGERSVTIELIQRPIPEGVDE